MRVPQELVERVLENLDDSIDTLTTCALVSRSWLPAARYHLYTTVPLITVDTCNKLLLTLYGNPALTPLIRMISLHGERVYAIFVNATMLFPYLHTFEVWGVDLGWNAISPVISQRMPELRGLVLRQVSMHVTDFMQALRSAPPSLKELELHDFYVVPEWKIGESLREKPAVVKDLMSIVIGHSNIQSWIRHPNCPVNIMTSKRLEVTREFHILEHLLPHMRMLRELAFVGSMSEFLTYE
jgi:hypothetical protein